MSRFKDLCSSSDDSDEQVQSGPVRRGRQRETKRFVQVKTKTLEQADTAQIIIPKKNKPKQQKPKQLQQQLSLKFQTNEYKQNSSLNANEKFIRQQIKPVQQQMQHFLEKIQQIKTERKKFTTALTTSSRDLQKVLQKIAQLKTEELTNKYSSRGRQNRESQKPDNQKVSSKLKNMQQLQAKITLHLSKLMKQHQKTIQLVMQCRKDMDKTFQKVKFIFLDLSGFDFYNQQTEEFQEYGIAQVYRILQVGDDLVQEITSFSK